ncbi:MAG: ribbon-helix-helix domain-containing protein [Hyphomicrobiales bacterium]|nr:ribbon-helix-helix domain-containing protein [Hyphomicrobiales bacterium]
MCRLFASAPPDIYAFETRSIRLNGQSTSVRLEKVFWDILEEIAASEGLTLPRFISTLHQEILLLHGEVSNFTSHLRCICVMARNPAQARARPPFAAEPAIGVVR